jgi:hypothetical protein
VTTRDDVVARWLAAIDANEATEVAAAAVIALGGDAVAALIPLLRGEHRRQRHALLLLARLGPEALPALPAIAACWSWEASYALAAIGEAGLPGLMAQLSPHAVGARHALEAIRQLGPRAAPAVPAIIASFAMRLPVHDAPANALAAIGDEAIPALLASAEHDDPRVRLWTMRALGTLRPLAGLPAAVAALRDPELRVRAWAARAIGRIADQRGEGGLDLDTIVSLIEAFRAQSHPQVQRWIAWAIGQPVRVAIRARKLQRPIAPRVMAYLRDVIAPELVAWLPVRDVAVHQETLAAIRGLTPILRGQPDIPAVYGLRTPLGAMVGRRAAPALADLVDPGDDDLRRELAYRCIQYLRPPRWGWRERLGDPAIVAARTLLGSWLDASRDDVGFASAAAVWSLVGCSSPAVLDYHVPDLEQRALYRRAHEGFLRLRAAPAGTPLRLERLF